MFFDNNDTSAIIKLLDAAHHMVCADWQHPEVIVGQKDNLFPHLAQCFREMETRTGVSFPKLLEEHKLLLNAYTCYPPIPTAFLLSGGFAENTEELKTFLGHYLLTLDGGLSIGRSPWNCPALRASILAVEKLKEQKKEFALIHGNGGIGETQGLVLIAV